MAICLRSVIIVKRVIKIRYRGLSPVSFDIETTGLSPIQDEFICASLCKNKDVMTAYSLEELNNLVRKINKKETLLVTYNGGTFYNSGFDFPFLRWKYIKQNLNYNLAGFKHLDLYTLVDKHLNLFKYKNKPPSKSSLYKPDLVKLAEANDLEYENKNKTYSKLKEKEDTDWLDYTKEKRVSLKSEQNLYQLLFDEDGEEEYIDGADVTKLYEEGKLQDIIRHNQQDVKRLNGITDRIFDVFPDESIRNVIETL